MPDSRVLTIAICTHNRAEDVRACLNSLFGQIVPGTFPIIVIDSASIAAEAARLRDLASEFAVTYLREEVAGLSRARNAAARHADTEWIAFLDDDATVRDGWLSGIVAAMAEADVNVGLIGGAIHAAWPDGIDHSHVTARWKLLLSCVEGQSSGPIGTGRNICGANLAIRKLAWGAAKGFPEELGRVGTRLISGEESWIIERLIELGWHVRYDGRFAVDHHIQPERLTIEWVRKRAYWEGVSCIKLMTILGKQRPRSLNPLKLAASVPVHFLLGLIRDKPDDWIRASMAYGSLRGTFL